MEKIWTFIEEIVRLVLNRVFHLHVSEESIGKILQFIKFGVVGISNTLISYIMYLILVAVDFHYLFASLMGFLISVINAFYWNNKYVFRLGEREERMLWRSFVKTFMAYAGTGLILNNILLFVWIDIFKINELVGPIINLFITIPLNFLLNKYWAFKTSRSL